MLESFCGGIFYFLFLSEKYCSLSLKSMQLLLPGVCKHCADSDEFFAVNQKRFYGLEVLADETINMSW